jgi:2-methylisocitrate lyase-like PEP mutase family enzyme
MAFNQIAGGRSPAASLSTLSECGVSLVIYSTPCLFAAQEAIGDALDVLKRQDGLLGGPAAAPVDLARCNAVLMDNVRSPRHS